MLVIICRCSHIAQRSGQCLGRVQAAVVGAGNNLSLFLYCRRSSSSSSSGTRDAHI